MNRRGALKSLLALPGVGTIATVNVRPTDTIVIESREALAQKEIAHIERAARDVWPKQKVVVLQCGLTLRVVREAEGEEP